MAECFLYGNGSLSDFKIKIIGSTEQPEGKENLIWIKTNIEISGYRLSYSKPENVPNGFLWMKIGGKNDNINLDKKNKVAIPVDSAYIYMDGKWISVEASIFKNGAWTQFCFSRIYLYNKGDKCTDLTKDWKIVNHNGASSSLGVDCINLTLKGSENMISNVHTTSTVLVPSGYKTLCANVNLTRNSKIAFGLGTGLALAGASYKASTVVEKQVGDIELRVDVSALEGAKTQYVVFYTSACVGKITEVWFERGTA